MDLMHLMDQTWRQIRQAPVVAIVVVASLAVGISVNASVFSWVQARLFAPLPGVARSASLRLVEPVNDNGLFVGTSWRDYLDLRERVTAFPALIAGRMMPTYVGDSGSVERVFGMLVSDNYFSALRVTPAAGRVFTAADVSVDGREPLAILSWRLAQSRFGDASSAVGRTLRVNGQVLTVVGVMADEFQGTVLGLQLDVYLPATIAPLLNDGSTELRARDVRGYMVMGHLADGISETEAARQVSAVMAELTRQYPDTNRGITAQVLPFWQSPRGPQRMMAAALVVLQLLMLVVWLAVCGNAANLVLARASRRAREVSVHLALGATPARIRRFMLTETVALGLVAGSIGAMLAVWGTRVLIVLPMTGLPVRFQTELDGWGLGFSIALGVLSGLIVGTVPAWHLSRLEPQAVLQSATRSAGRGGLRNALMGAQVVLATIVVMAAGLFLRSFLDTKTIDPGFDQDGILLTAFDVGGRPVAREGGRVLALRLLEQLAGRPGVGAAALSTSVPLDIHGLPGRVFTIDGRQRADGEFDQALSNTVTPGYFDLMGIARLAGTDFAPLTDLDQAPQAIVNEAFVRTYITPDGPLESALGRSIEARGRSQRIVGVVDTTVANAFGEPPAPVIYFSYRDGAPPMGEVHVRTRAGAELTRTTDVRAAINAIDSEVPVFNVRTLRQHVESNLVFRRVPARLFVVLGPLLLILVAAGIYAVVSYVTTLRTQEIGVRLALGATPSRLIWESVGSAMRVVIAGAMLGWVVMFIGTTAFFSEATRDVWSFVGVPVLLLVVAAWACWVPSRRCAAVDPLTSLRQQ